MSFRSVVAQHRSPAAQRVRACAVLLAVLMLLVSASAQAAPGAARRPAAPFDLLGALRSWLVAQIAPTADDERGGALRAPDSSKEAGSQSTLVNTSGNSDAGATMDPDGHH